jgi:hypothetical protein
MTLREIFRAFEGAAIARRRAQQAALWAAWHVASLTNAKKLPDLPQLLRKLEPLESRVMSPKAQRLSILSLAQAFGADVVRRKKGEALQ